MRVLLPIVLVLLVGLRSPPPSPSSQPCKLMYGVLGSTVFSSLGHLTLCIPSRFTGGRVGDADLWVDTTLPAGELRPSIEIRKTVFQDSSAADWANVAQGMATLRDSSGTLHVLCIDCPSYQVDRSSLDTLDGRLVRVEMGTLSGLFLHYENAAILRATWPLGAPEGILIDLREPQPGQFPEMRLVLGSVRWQLQD